MSKEVRQKRLEKIEKLKELGITIYPDGYNCTHTLMEAKALPDGEKVRVAGRIITTRGHGKLIFADLMDLKDHDLEIIEGMELNDNIIQPLRDANIYFKGEIVGIVPESEYYNGY